MKLEEALTLMNARFAAETDPALSKIDVTSFSTDSRQVKAGDLFFAFSQPEFANNGFNGDFRDAHEFIPQAFEKGAAACVVRADRFEEHIGVLEGFRERLVFVPDVIVAFQDLAKAVAAKWGGKIVGVTGSAGKTTAKEMTAHVLSSEGRKVLRNTKNLNNGLGLPMTVLALEAEPAFDLAVLEMGMSTPMHEIRRLCEITPPDVAIVLNVLPVHLEHLGTIERIAEAKAELVAGLKPDGVAVLNADDFRVAAMAVIHEGKVITYGTAADADVRAEGISMPSFGRTEFTLVTPEGSARTSIPLAGRHNVSNALAAAACGFQFGMSADEIGRALESVPTPAQRGEVELLERGITLINDSYNSNPDALLKMVETLIEGSPEGSRRIVVAGEMLELGAEEVSIHRRTGRRIGEMGVDALVGVRGLARELVEGAREAGVERTEFFDTPGDAGQFVAGILAEGDTVLVKGSRGVRTELAIEALKERLGAGIVAAVPNGE